MGIVVGNPESKLRCKASFRLKSDLSWNFQPKEIAPEGLARLPFDVFHNLNVYGAEGRTQTKPVNEINLSLHLWPNICKSYCPIDVGFLQYTVFGFGKMARVIFVINFGSVHVTTWLFAYFDQ